MAGSLNHILDDDGNFTGTSLLDEGTADAFQALEDCYAIIYHLTKDDPDALIAACKAAKTPTPKAPLSGKAKAPLRGSSGFYEKDYEEA